MVEEINVLEHLTQAQLTQLNNIYHKLDIMLLLIGLVVVFGAVNIIFRRR